MSVIHNFTLSQMDNNTESLEQNLRESGAIISGANIIAGKEYVCEVLDYRSLAPEEAQRIENDILKAYPETSDEDLKRATQMPVEFSNDGREMSWALNMSSDDTPAFLISKAYPDESFRFKSEVEMDVIADIVIKNGENTGDFKEPPKNNINIDR